VNIIVRESQNDCCLIFDGEMTCKYSREIENRIIESMRSHQFLKVDLSGVRQIDLCGIHLLGVLRSFGNDAVSIVAASPVVREAWASLRPAHRSKNRRAHVLGLDYQHHAA